MGTLLLLSILLKASLLLLDMFIRMLTVLVRLRETGPMSGIILLTRVVMVILSVSTRILRLALVGCGL